MAEMEDLAVVVREEWEATDINLVAADLVVEILLDLILQVQEVAEAVLGVEVAVDFADMAYGLMVEMEVNMEGVVAEVAHIQDLDLEVAELLM